MSGRGRGINNAPAWMTRGGGGGPGGYDGPGGGPGGGGDHPGDRDGGGNHMMGGGGPDPYGRGPRGGGGGGGGDMYGRGPPPRGGGGGDRFGGGGGGGDYNRYGDRYDDRYDHNDRYGGGGGPPDHHYRGGGGGGGNYHRGGGGPPPRRGGGGDGNHRRGGGGNMRGGGDRGGGGGGGRGMGDFYDDFANDFDMLRENGGDPSQKQHQQNQRQQHPPGRGPQKGGPASKRWKFRSYEEEMNFVEGRRKKRMQRTSKFDVLPTPEQVAADAAAIAYSNPAATDFAGVVPTDRNFSALPQQTRHARRLYIGQLPPNVHEEELHYFFKDCIEKSLIHGIGGYTLPLKEDPILSVYINHERRFCFLEFKTVEMTTACMALDGININGKGKVKVKRPNDYNPSMAPNIHPSTIPQLDTSKLGIISGTVPDGPNKIFVGGLHYHLTEEQVLELLSAFGKVKAFHLVKNDPDSSTSKGYCFVEYIDPKITQIAVIGLNGMDLGGGKMLTARVAGERNNSTTPTTLVQAGGVAFDPNNTAAVAAAALGAALPGGAGMMGGQVMCTPVGGQNSMLGMLGAGQQQQQLLPQQQAAIPAGANIVNGYDIDVLVDAAMGLRPMPTAPMHVDQFGIPITLVANNPKTGAAAVAKTTATIPNMPAAAGIMNPQQQQTPMGLGGGGMVGLPQQQQQQQQQALPPPPPPLPPQQQQMQQQPQAALAAQPSALEIANKALDALYGGGGGTTTQPGAMAPTTMPLMNNNAAAAATTNPTMAMETRILVLSNLVTDEDLATNEDYNMLKEEVFDECQKFGNLKSMEIPRDTNTKKIFLEYETVDQARNANRELSGRRFGPNVVQTSYLSEADYVAKNFR